MMALSTQDIEAFYELLLQETHGQVFDDQGRIAINSPASQQALDIIRKLRTAGICSDVAAYSQEWMAGFNDDSIATYPCAVWLAGTIKDATTDSAGGPKWGVFRLPAVAPGGVHVANWGGSVLVIPDSCPNKAAAWAFVQYALCTQEGQLEQYEHQDLFPSFLPALKSPVMDKPDPFFCGQPVGRLFATDITQIWHLNRTAHWVEASGYVQQDLSHWGSIGMPKVDVFGTLASKLHERLDIPIAPASTTAEAMTGCHGCTRGQPRSEASKRQTQPVRLSAAVGARPSTARPATTAGAPQAGCHGCSPGQPCSQASKRQTQPARLSAAAARPLSTRREAQV
jgi:hypothetical protein